MRIVITDANLIWGPENPALAPYAELVLVVCLHGRAVTDRYECFVSPYQDDETFLCGGDRIGVDDRRYAALESAADRLGEALGDEAVILADFTLPSLFPYLALRGRTEEAIHLCAVSPRGFAGREREEAYRAMLHDLSGLSSLFLLDGRRVPASGASDAGLRERIAAQYERLLPRILYGIQERDWTRAFFDFFTESYLPLREGFDRMEAALERPEIDPAQIRRERVIQLMGSPDYTSCLSNDRYTYEQVERLVPRSDGKAVCEYLRGLRLRLAAANGIPFTSEECPSDGPCAGTCGKCDREAKELYERMQDIPAGQRVYPRSILEGWGTWS